MYTYGILILFLISAPSRAMEPDMNTAVLPKPNSPVIYELSRSTVQEIQVSSLDVPATDFENTTDEDFFGTYGLTAGRLGKSLYGIFYRKDLSAVEKDQEKTFVMNYINEGSRRGRNLLQEKISTGVHIRNLRRDVESLKNQRSNWEGDYCNAQASYLKLQTKVAVLQATSVGLAGLAAYLYMNKI